MSDPKFRFNTRELSAYVRRAIAENPQKVKKAMTDVKNLLVLEVKKRTPVDEGILTSCITGKVEQYQKSHAATVFVPINSPASKYAIYMHEGQYKLRANSIAKQSKTGCEVGAKYISRTLEDNRQKISDLILSELKKK